LNHFFYLDSVLKEIASCLDSIESICSASDDVMETINSIRIKIFFPMLNRMGWVFEKLESHESTKIRSLAIINLALSGHKETLDDYHERISKFILENDESVIHPNLIEQGLCVFLSRSSEQKDFDAVFKIYDTSTNDSYKTFALRALGGVNSLALVTRLFEMSLDSKLIRKVDLISLLRGVCDSQTTFSDELKPMMNKW
jgi:aminopeptidase 2